MNNENLIDLTKYIIDPSEGKIYSKYKASPLDGTIKENGYVQVKLLCIDNKRRCFYLHRVIWYYLNGEIPKNMQVNHIDENKTNNKSDNLNLMSPKDNCNWGTRNKRLSELQNKKAILQYNKNGDLIGTYESLNEIHKKYGFVGINISRACVGGYMYHNKWINYKHAYGFVWKYKNEQPN